MQPFRGHTAVLRAPADGDQPFPGRGRLAVNPPVAPLRVKKAAVKLVRKAGPVVPVTPIDNAAPRTVLPLQVGELEESQVNEARPVVNDLENITPATGAAAEGDDLRAIMARLKASKSATQSLVATPRKEQDSTTLKPVTADGAAPFLSHMASPFDSRIKGTESSGGSFQKRSIENYFPKTSKEDAKNLVREELEISYLQKALEYLMLLPSLKRESYSTDYMKSAAEKFAHATKFSDKAKYPTSAKLKAKFVEAATNYLNSLTRNAGHDQIATDSIVKLISQTEGNYLCFCATLMTMGKLGAADLDEVVGLANAVSAVLQENVEKPYRCSAVKKPTSVENSVPIKRPFAFKKPAAFQNPGGVEKSPAVSEHKTFKTLFKPSEHLPAPESVNSPLDNLTAWPKAEQRDNIAGSRTVMLQNVSSILTLNELQSLVWGGPVETFRFQPGQSTAMVKFATPEGCDNYYKATENGIQIPGGTTFVFVKRQPSLNSVNDLLKVVISQKVTRCVRALDAEEGWNEDVLLKLARGPGEKKRDVDKIVRDKTPEGRLYIEFRFGNVYQALNFKRALQDDEEWESCVLVYASDPCELYTSIHPLG